MTTGGSSTSARALAPLALAGVLALSACGGDGASDDETTAVPDPSASGAPSEPAASGDEAGPSVDAAPSAPAGPPPAVPTGTVPEGWTVLDPGGAATFALPADAAEQDVPDTGIEGLEISLYAVPDGSLLALYQSFPEDVAGSVAPEQLLAQAAEGALGAATFAEGTAAEEPFAVGDYAGTQISGLDAATETWLAGRLVVVDDVLLGFVATDPDEAAAEASLDEAWATLTLP
ncbi:hypothetical protein [Aquipuribacter sp. MA13-6]|uniref:hypothetical protein n=1 Tax=unclassified Aquipuribacter TaxID=2635084 RepID=UPI003EEE1D9E